MDVELTVDISRFFRDKQMWQFMTAHVFPQLSEQDVVRAWVMGSANGEEVYTLVAAWYLGMKHLPGGAH